MVTLRELNDYAIGDRVEITYEKKGHTQYTTIGYINNVDRLIVEIIDINPKEEKGKEISETRKKFLLEDIAFIGHLNLTE